MPAHVASEPSTSREPARGPWSVLRGPLCALVLGTVYQYADPSYVAPFDHEAIFLFAVVIVGFLDGLVPGLLTAGIGAIVLLFGREDPGLLHHGPFARQHDLVSALVLPGVAALVGLLRGRYDQVIGRERAARAYQTAVVQNSLDPILVVGADGIVEDVNRAVYDVLGHRPGTMRGRSVDDFLHPDDRATLRDEIHRAVRESGYAAELDARFRHADGEWRTLELRGRGLEGQAGIRGVVLSTRDVTEHIEAGRALRESEERFRALVENSAEVFAILDADGSFRYRSPSFTRLLGWETGHRDEEPFGLVHPEDRDRARGLLEDLLARPGSTTGPTELRFEHADGGWRTIEVSGTNLTGNPSVEGIVINFRDVSERRDAERARRQSEALYRQIVETSEEGVWMIDERRMTTFVNERMAEILGVDPDTMIGRPAHEFQPGQAPEDIEERIERRRHGVRETFELETERADGASLWLSFSASPLFDEAGEYIGALALVTDVTERRRAEEELRQTHKMEGIGRLAGAVAHDFNNVLTAISGFSELVLTDPGLPERQRENVSEIRSAAERARGLTRQLLAFSRRQVLEPRSLELPDVVREMEPMLRQLIGDGVDLVTRFDPETPPIHADRGQIEQVLLNLVVNAGDAMSGKGILTIATSFEEPDQAAVASEAPVSAGLAVLEVSDTGHGMDETTVQRMFEPFFTTKPETRGTGLGLATVYGIVSQSGGRIEVETKPGEGTTVRVLVPRASVEGRAPETPPGDPVPSETVPAARVLLVEDDPAVRGLARIALRSAGHVVFEAVNGVEALQRAQDDSLEIELVVTDVRMPEMGGAELVERLRAGLPDLPVIFISGYPEKLFEEAGEALENAAFLAKPFTPSELVAVVREALSVASRGSG